MKNNHQRILGEVLALDAWHEPFAVDQKSYGVFVELSFSEGRMGGDDPDIPFTFSLGLRRALMTITLEDPLRVDRYQVARGIPAKQGQHSQIIKAKDLARAKIGANANISPALMKSAISGEVSRESEISREDEIRFVQELPETLVTPRPLGGVGYTWEVEPLLRPTLKGQPWDPTEEARVRVIAPPSSGIDPAIKIEVRCALEDLHVSNLKPKDERILAKMKALATFDLNEAVAIQHIKKVLAESQLYPGKLDNRFSDILLADILAISA